MKNLKNQDIFFILLFIILSCQSQAQDYYIYGKTQPKLKTLPEIAEHYQVDVLEMLDNSCFLSENMNYRYFKFEQKIDVILDKTINYNIIEQVGLEWHKVRKMFIYQYMHHFPLQRGDSLTLPCGKINPINRQGNFEEFDKLFPEIPIPEDFIFSKEEALRINLSMGQSQEMPNYIPQKPKDCICDSTKYEEDIAFSYLPRFKFKLNQTTSAYFVMTRSDYPYNGYLYLFRNRDKKLYFEKGISVYEFYEPSPAPSMLSTNTQIKDYDKDGDLDILICKTNFFYSEPTSRTEKSLKVLLWDEKNKSFIARGEYSSQETTKYFFGDNYSRKIVYSQKTTSFHPEASYSEEEILKILGNSPE